jgi:hypothetical protein
MRTWPTQFQQWMESAHPWLKGVRADLLVPLSAITALASLAWRVTGEVPAVLILWVLLCLCTLPRVSWQPSLTESDALRRVFYLWCLCLLPVVPLAIPQNPSAVLLGVQFAWYPAAAPWLATALLFWPWMYAASAMVRRLDPAVSIAGVIAFVVSPFVGVALVDLSPEASLVLPLMVHLTTMTWLLLRRAPRRFGNGRGLPRGTIFIVLSFLHIAAWFQLLWFFADAGPMHRGTQLRDPDDIWLYSSRFFFAASFAAQGLAMAAVAEDVDGK